MYHPTTRLLTALELLQTHALLSGDELARRLEVEPRSVRRYIQMIQEMGIPVEGSRGPGGGYRLRPGYKLPPLLFTEEEATAIVLGLLGTPWLEIELPSVAVEGALAKIYRVLPQKGRDRLQSISSHMILSSHRLDTRPDASLLVQLSEAVQLHRRVAIGYSSHHKAVTERKIEPYGIVGWRGHWYVVGYCCLRQEYRTFRLDRISNAQFLHETFVPDEDFDCQSYVIRHLTTVPARWQIEVLFTTELHLVRYKVPSMDELVETEAGILWRTHHVSLDAMARYLVGLDLPFVVQQPPELREALRVLARQMLQIADME